MSVLAMPWEDLRRILRVMGPEIGRLAKRGDRFAKKVFDRYVYAFEHPNDPVAHKELRVAIDDYLKRDLRISERIDLGAKFGHLLEEKPTGPRIFVPEGIAPVKPQ